MSNTDRPLDAVEAPLKSKNYKLLIVVLGIVVFFLFVGYIDTRRNTVPARISQNVAPTNQALVPTRIIKPQLSSLGNGWIVKSSRFCAVEFQSPPNNAPYFELIGQDASNPENRRFWQLREGAQTANGRIIFTNNSSLIYIADREDSGYADINPNSYTQASGYKETKGFITGLVGVQCAPKASYSLANIAESYAASFTGVTVKNKRMTTLWGKEVVAATFTGGLFKNDEIYFIITNDKVYKIEKRSDSTKEFIKNTTDQIFNNLQFAN